MNGSKILDMLDAASYPSKRRQIKPGGWIVVSRFTTGYQVTVLNRHASPMLKSEKMPRDEAAEYLDDLNFDLQGRWVNDW